jgi:hypothetical protein
LPGVDGDIKVDLDIKGLVLEPSTSVVFEKPLLAVESSSLEDLAELPEVMGQTLVAVGILLAEESPLLEEPADLPVSEPV